MNGWLHNMLCIIITISKLYGLLNGVRSFTQMYLFFVQVFLVILHFFKLIHSVFKAKTSNHPSEFQALFVSNGDESLSHT